MATMATLVKFEIKNRWSGKVIFSHECKSIKEAVAALNPDADLSGADLSGADLRGADLSGANLRGADLHGADLHGADLHGADLRGADLSGANLIGANLRGANLRGADLHGADLRGADLRGADLSGANLRGANLRGANLRGANLRGANLSGADLRGADLSGANLTPIRDDIWAVLSAAPAEVPALRSALAEGRINGSVYSGECCCLVGTLGKAHGGNENCIPGLAPNAARPAEMFFLPIRPGQTAETSQHVKLALEWVDQWLANVRAAIAVLSV